jgi:NMD protein affecting ribosome stability and mRNA decay
MKKTKEVHSTRYTCPLCGTEFEKGENSVCKSCPLGSRTCNLLCCPNCGYEWPEGSRWVDRIKNVLTHFGIRLEKED